MASSQRPVPLLTPHTSLNSALYFDLNVSWHCVLITSVKTWQRTQNHLCGSSLNNRFSPGTSHAQLVKMINCERPSYCSDVRFLIVCASAEICLHMSHELLSLFWSTYYVYKSFCCCSLNEFWMSLLWVNECGRCDLALLTCWTFFCLVVLKLISITHSIITVLMLNSRLLDIWAVRSIREKCLLGMYFSAT